MIEVDGIPVFTANGTPGPVTGAPGPVTGGLLFRVGMADETYGNHGITHLVEHLAFTGLLQKTAHANGVTTDGYTGFMANGERAEVVAFLNQIAQNLAQLPLDRLEAEKAILQTEETRRGGPVGEARLVRHGLRDYGLSGAREHGLYRVGTAEAAQWAAMYFTAGNAVAFLTCEDATGLHFPLPGGVRRPLPAPSLNPGADPLPRAYGLRCNAVVLEALVGRSPAVGVLAELAKTRFLYELRVVDALSYSLDVSLDVFLDTTRFTCVADTTVENGAGVAGCLVDALGWLGAGRFTPEEFDEAKAAALKPFDEDGAEARFAAGLALDWLYGRAPETMSDKRGSYAAVTAADVRRAAQEVQSQAVWVAPVKTLAWAGIPPVDEALPPVEGHHFPRLGGPGGLTVSDQGITSADGTGRSATVLFADCVGVEAHPDGRRLVVATNGTVVEVEPTLYEGLTPALAGALIDPHIGTDRLIMFPARRPDQIPVPPVQEGVGVAPGGGAPGGASVPGYAPAPGYPPGAGNAPAPGNTPAAGVPAGYPPAPPGYPPAGTFAPTAPPGYPPAPGQVTPTNPPTLAMYPMVSPMPTSPARPGQATRTAMTVLFVVLAVVFGVSALFSVIFLIAAAADTTSPDAGTAAVVFGVLSALTVVPTILFIWLAVRAHRGR